MHAQTNDRHPSSPRQSSPRRRPFPSLGAWSLLLGLTATAALGGLTTQPAAAAARNRSDEIAECQRCHGKPSLSVVLPSGERLSLHVDQTQFASSVHGKKLGCIDCHRDIVTAPRKDPAVPHATGRFETRRQLALAAHEQCKRCHFATYSKTLDSIHYESLTKGDPRAPICADCHGAHAMAPPGQPRSRISGTCSRCHEDISKAYLSSVHGRALIEEGNRDVPICTDCHHSHDIAAAQTPRFHMSTPELCGRCHTNETLMRPYGLSVDVRRTYLAEFHGTGNRAAPSNVVATCVDCHGIHDIAKPTEVGPEQMRRNLEPLCAECHSGAKQLAPAEWLSHYEPSWRSAWLVYTVKLLFRLFIPALLGAFILQLLMHLWRFIVNR